MTRPTDIARAALATATILVALGIALPAAAMPPGNMFPKLTFAETGADKSDATTLSSKGAATDPRCGLLGCRSDRAGK